MIKRIVYLYLLINFIYSQGAWMMSNRTHPELTWKTIKTENFNIHFHEGLYDISLKGANMAEKIRPTLMKQVGLNSLQRIDIVFTSEDEISNGFATPANYTVIWVDQNDMAIWAEDEKWLRTVLAHELQHLVYFNVTKSWLPSPMNELYGRSPGWVVEGLAEYFTEKWRPERFDISHKYHVIKNSIHKIKDPHNDGFSKVLYFADRFGDEKLVKILNHRDTLKLYNFSQGFKKHTGITVKQFEEEWRRQMNTYFFGLRSQKETYADIGKTHSLPMRYVYGFDWFEGDTTKIIMVGRRNDKQRDLSLILAIRDTSKEKEIYKKRIEKKKNKKPTKVKPIWKLEELDYGGISNYVKASPDGKKIVYSKYGYGKNQSLTWDIHLIDLKSKDRERLTNSKRANNPCWSPDSRKIAFVSHKNSTSNLFTISLDDTLSIERITNYSGNVQIVTPAWSPDGGKIAYALSKEDGNMDIVVFDLDRKEPVRVTNQKQVDYRPVWHPKGNEITYTSHSNMTPNFHTVDINTKKSIQNTNIGDAVWTVGWNYDNTAITGLTLGDVDSARIVDVYPHRIAENNDVAINPLYSRWRDKRPDHVIPNLDSLPDIIDALESQEYSSIDNIKHLGTIIFPDVTGLLYTGAYTDVTGRNIFQSFVFSDWEKVYGGFGYLNATGRPIGGFWGVNYYKDVFFEERIYNQDNDYLIEFYNGLELFGYRNHNFGNIISSNHNIRYALKFFDRKVVVEPESLDVFSQATPESGKEGSFSLAYTFVKKRPDLNNLYIPRNGYGLKLEGNFVDKNIWGDFTYNHYNIDAYINKKIGPTVLYIRGRYEIVSGNPPAQETAGLVDIPSNYYVGQIVFGKEHMSPRGWEGSNLGDRAFMGSAELRSPLLNLNVLEIMRIVKAGKLSFSCVSDFGKVWGSQNNDWIVTAGLEARLAIIIGNMPLFIYSAGIAQTLDQWSENPSAEGIQPYIRLALVNPF
jgi:hypothetical protein